MYTITHTLTAIKHLKLLFMVYGSEYVAIAPGTYKN